MPAYSVEEHLNSIELELAQTKKQLEEDKRKLEANAWEKVFGAFANSEGFEEAVRFG